MSGGVATPATPEIANLFGGDLKFLSSLSDSDQLRYQELCSKRPSSTELSAVRRLSKSPLLNKARSNSAVFTCK